MRIRQLTAGDYHGPGQRKMQAKIARGVCAVSVDAGEMPHLPAWFTYTIGTFDRKRVTLSPAPSGAKRGYKAAARDLLLKAQRDYNWSVEKEARAASVADRGARAFDAALASLPEGVREWARGREYLENFERGTAERFPHDQAVEKIAAYVASDHKGHASGALARQQAEAPMVRRFDADASHPLTYTHPTGAVAWLRRTTFGGRKGFRMMIAPALGRAAKGEGPTVIEDLSDAANQLDAIVAARFGDNWNPAE